jgi:lauroyl/myristoyl acyltransferase
LARFRIGAKLIRAASQRAVVTDEAAIELTTKIHAALEPVIRAHPEQYLWVHNRYKTRPPEE